MKKIAIIGGAGFIGTHTTSLLLNNNYDVIVIDKKENELLKHHSKPFKYIKCDVTDKNHLRTIMNDYKFDAVYMLAGISDSQENLKSLPDSLEQNIISLTNVLECVKDFNIKRIIFSSTVWVYSVSKATNVNETTNLPINKSNHIYTSNKLMCEQLIQHYHNLYDVNYTILRYGVAYGPGCHPSTILSQFITNAINNKKCIINGNGSVYRNFLYVTDHARANMAALNEKAKNKIINVDGNEKITLNCVAETVKKLNGKIKLEYNDKRAGEYKGKNVSNNRSRKLLNWSPKINFTTGSKFLYDYIKGTK